MFRILIIFFLVFTSVSLYADVKIYLHSTHDAGSEEITLGEIASIEGPESLISDLKGINISKKIYLDGYIDRKEIVDIVSPLTSEQLYIYGSAVRVVHQTIDDEQFDNVTIKAGSQIKVVAVKKSIKVESYGTALDTGNEGNIINVKMKGQKIVKGRVVSKETVIVDL